MLSKHIERSLSTSTMIILLQTKTIEHNTTDMLFFQSVRDSQNNYHQAMRTQRMLHYMQIKSSYPDSTATKEHQTNKHNRHALFEAWQIIKTVTIKRCQYRGCMKRCIISSACLKRNKKTFENTSTVRHFSTPSVFRFPKPIREQDVV